MDHSCSPAGRGARAAPRRGLAAAWPLLLSALLLAGAAERVGAQGVIIPVNGTYYRVITQTAAYGSDDGRFGMQPWFTGDMSGTPGDPGTLLAAAFSVSSVDVEGV